MDKEEKAAVTAPVEEKEGKKKCCASDRRTFVISLLTAVIVVLIYHIGTVCCRNFCKGPCRDSRGCPMERVMLVKLINDCGPGACDMPQMRHHGKRRQMMGQPGGPEMPGQDAHHNGRPGAPGPAPLDAPAPAPVK